MIAHIPAIERARQFYIHNHVSVPFEIELGEYLRDGYVVSSPDDFGMAKPMTLEDGRESWFICMAVGRLERIAAMLPFYRPWVCFFRHWKTDRLRVYPMDKMLKATISV